MYESISLSLLIKSNANKITIVIIIAKIYCLLCNTVLSIFKYYVEYYKFVIFANMIDKTSPFFFFKQIHVMKKS